MHRKENSDLFIPGMMNDVSKSNVELMIHGLGTKVLAESDLIDFYYPVLQSLTDLSCDRRAIAFLSGPPGSGKSTLAVIFQALARQTFNRKVTVLPMDGFHFTNDELRCRFTIRDGQNIRLVDIKGPPETFDLENLRLKLKALYDDVTPLTWPAYDRQIHDVVPGALAADSQGLFIVEGNYLLLDQPGWCDLKAFAHKTIFVSAPESVLIDRLIARHVRGGKSPGSAREWVLRTDLDNIRCVLNHRLPADFFFSF